ncbi:hypothetical protein B0A55_05936 [Friedmanniomyces simplex]|uniref:Heterokaryon incompatibility domain-containing protein n=1 Tax=Friedmanniomyces simplex TaxID=329884 RepID=A0A4U0XH50_9PEZI|nr:hypothetical protein B0A55_05936 [Friedmanniomyces simplex]
MSSVRDRVSRLETTGHGGEQGVVPELPRRRSQLLPPDDASGPLGTAPPGKPRPPVPPKAKSLSGHVVTVGRKAHPPEIKLLDLEEADEEDTLVLKHVEPIPELDAEDPPSTTPSPRSSLDSRGGGRDEEVKPPLPIRRTPSPFAGVTQGFVKLRLDAPKAFRTLSEGAQKAARNVQNDTPKVFQSIADGAQKVAQSVQTETPKMFQDVSGGAQKTFGALQRDAPKAFLGAAQGTQRVVSEVQAGFKRTINGIPVPAPFAQTGEDLSDLAKLQMGRAGLCSRCAALDVATCFDRGADTDQPYRCWASPLSRVALHAKWCLMCKLLVEMLCRKEHDPLRSAEIRDHIKPDWLKSVPFHKWISEGYIHQDEYWPFGRSASRYEGSTQVVGPFSDALWTATKRLRPVGLRVLTRAAVGGRPSVNRKDFAWSRSQAYRDGLEQGSAHQRFPISAVVIITVSMAHSETPGLLWCDLDGCSNRPEAEAQVLSHFMLQVVKNKLVVTVTPRLSYGHVLDSRWIDVPMSKLWLAECEKYHGKGCSEHGWALALESPGFLRLIDVDQLRVTIAEKPQSCRYVALSYVWGGADVLKLTSDNVRELAAAGGLKRNLALLPRTVMDAMQVTKAAGERYLWVDALCILQDNSEESGEQIANMDKVYGSALFTIVAAEGEHADVGLTGVRNEAFLGMTDEGTPRHIVQPTAPLKKDLTVIAPFERGRATPANHRSWESRAWTFQERHLSRRMLIFGNNEMVWHCRGMVAREDMPVEQSGYEHATLDWLALKPQHLGVGVDEYWRDGSFETNRHGRTHLVRSATFAEYARLVGQYSQRTMTHESDAVNAFAGLLRIFSLAFESECIYGLPSVLLDVALLWRSVDPLQKRKVNLGFPSWSWAAWKGRVAYAEPVSIRRDEGGQMITIEGVQPMLRYFAINPITGSLQPLNGTGRGIPVREDNLPVEWEAHNPRRGYQDATHSCQTPDLFDLDPRIIPHLGDRHLVFWTSTCGRFRLSEEKAFGVSSSANQASILDDESNPVGVAVLDDPGTSTLGSDDPINKFIGTEMILMAEAHSSSLMPGAADDDFPCYLVMLVSTDSKTGIASRIGLGRLSKALWIASGPTVKLVCLG